MELITNFTIFNGKYAYANKINKSSKRALVYFILMPLANLSAQD